MKKLILLIIACFFITPIFSQKDFVEGIVLGESNAPLDYVNIGIIGTSLGTVSGAHGDFKLFFNEKIKETDTIRFSRVGFASQDFTVKALKSKDILTIKMEVRITTLSEVVVRPELLKTKTKGSKRTKTRMNVYYSISNKPNQNLGAEIGRKFKIRKITQLKKFRFYIAQNNFDTVRFRINVYHLKKRKPKENILNQNIVVEVVGGKSGWIEVDLEPYQIFSKKSIVVGVEWIYHSQKGRYLTLPIALAAKGPHFYKFGSQNKWKRFATMSSAMQLEMAY